MDDTPVRFVLHNNYGEQCGLACPVCGFEYVHIAGVSVYQGKTSTVITGERTLVTAIEPDDSRRGSEACLMFTCESGHGFRYKFEFRKGFVLVDLESCPDMENAPELWRD